MKTFLAVVILVFVVALGVVGFVYAGVYDVSARTPHGGLAAWLLSTISRESIEHRAGGIDVPDLDDEALVLAGINDFDAMCAGCHGAPGREPDAMGLGLNPPARDLAEEAAEMTPAELFWVTKNGIRMTGMPAWGITHDDESIWPVVAFMMKLPELDDTAYQELLAAAAGHGHHAGDAAPGDAHGSEDDEHAAESEPEPHDHSTHVHNDD